MIIGQHVAGQAGQPVTSGMEELEVASGAENLSLSGDRYGTHSVAELHFKGDGAEISGERRTNCVSSIGIGEAHMGDAVAHFVGHCG